MVGFHCFPAAALTEFLSLPSDELQMLPPEILEVAVSADVPNVLEKQWPELGSSGTKRNAILNVAASSNPEAFLAVMARHPAGMSADAKGGVCWALEHSAAYGSPDAVVRALEAVRPESLRSEFAAAAALGMGAVSRAAAVRALEFVMNDEKRQKILADLELEISKGGN